MENPTIETLIMNKKHHSRRNFSLTAFGQAAAGRALIFASLLALTACATSQHSQSSTDRFDQADENKDGKLSRGEVSDYLVAEIFASRDANHDGRMTLQEWSGDDPARAVDFKKRMLQRWDRDDPQAIHWQGQGHRRKSLREAEKKRTALWTRRK